MKLRTRLALAFLLMSVLPLTAITVYSYNSSLGAFRRAVEAEEALLAADMGRRMETVTAAVSERMDRVSAAAERRNWSERDAAQDERFRQQVAATLGEAVGLVSKLQFVSAPQPPPPPGAPRGTRPDRRRIQPPPPPPMRSGTGTDQSGSSPARAEGPIQGTGAPAPPGAPATEKRVVMDLVGVGVGVALSDAERRATVVDLDALKDAKALDSLTVFGMNVGDIVRQATGDWKPEAYGAAIGAAGRTIEQRARQIEQRAARERRPADHAEWMARMQEGKALDIPVRREGRVVGTMNAHISLDRVLLSVLSSRAPGSGEIAFAIDPQKRLHTARTRDRETIRKLNVIGELTPKKGAVQTITRGDWMVVARTDNSGVIFGIARPIGQALAEIRRATGRNLGLGMLAIAIALVGIAPLSRRMTRNLSVLHSGVNQIAQGNLQARVPVQSRDEIGQLAEAFNKMAEDLGAQQKLVAERERLRGELELCRQIQNEMLPKHPLRLRFAEIKGVSIPAREVGGDFFNYFLMPEGEVGLLVGDVSGKGVGAALLMANVQATLRARLPLSPDLAHLVDTIDHEVEANTPGSVYLTLFVGVLDSAQRKLRYVNAGHNPQYVLRAGGGLERLGSNGLPVGMIAGHGYEEGSVAVTDGDVLYFYTDGITEVENEQGEMYGSERLEELLLLHHTEGVDGLLARIEQDLGTFRGHAEPFDDATMMVLRLGGLGETYQPHQPHLP